MKHCCSNNIIRLIFYTNTYFEQFESEIVIIGRVNVIVALSPKKVCIYWLVDFKNNSSNFTNNSRTFRENSLFRIFMSDTFLAHYYKVRKKYISGNSRRVVLKLLFNEGTFLVPVWIIMKRNKLEHVALYLKVI